MEDLRSFKNEAKKSKKRTAHFFAEVDKGSAMPSWYNKPQMEELEEEIKRTERQINEGLVPKVRQKQIESELAAKKRRYELIEQAEYDVRKMVKKNPDAYRKRLEKLEQQISESMPSHDAMWRKDRIRTINPRDEAERMPHRTQLIKEWKILRHVFGEETNPEILRRGH